MKSDQERVSKLLTDTVMLLCKNGLVYSNEIKVQGLLGITVDRNEVFIVHIDELLGGSVGGVGAGSTKEKSGSAVLSESPARKKNPGMNSSKVVDLTRVADTPCPPVPQSFSGHVPHSPGRGMPVRRLRPAVPATMMLPDQPVGVHMQPRTPPRPRMNPAAAPLPTTPGKQMAANYLAQLKQHVARSMAPARMMSPPRQQRPGNRPPPPQQMMAPLHCSGTDDDGADDDDDVVIVGTGHEEPAPSWSSPMRKRPLPSHSSTSPVPPQKRANTRPPHPPARRPLCHDSAALIEQLSSADMAEALELSADDIPTSVEDIIKQIAATTPQKQGGVSGMPVQSSVSAAVKVANQVIQKDIEPVVADNSEPVKMGFSDVLDSKPARLDETIEAGSTVAEPVDEAMSALEQPATVLQQVPIEDSEAAGDEPLQPFVYTDFACDMDELGRTDNGIPGLAVLPSDEPPTDPIAGASVSCCQAPGCAAVFAEPAELSSHYIAIHSATGDLAIPPSVVMPTNIRPDSDADSKSPVGENVLDSDANVWPGIACPHPECGVHIGSYPGLVMHHRHVHGVPLPASQRREVAAVYRAHRQEAADQTHSVTATTAGSGSSAPHTVTSAEVSDSFICPFSSCGVWSFSREDLIAHIHLNHEGTDVMPSVCKQETDETPTASQ